MESGLVFSRLPYDAEPDEHGPFHRVQCAHVNDKMCSDGVVGGDRSYGTGFRRVHAPEVVTPLILTPLSAPATTTARTRRRRVLSLLAPVSREEHAIAVYEKYYPRLVRFVKGYRFSEQDAEDLAQEAFIRFYRSSYADRAEADWSLLQTVARSVLVNKMRAEKSGKRRPLKVDLDDVKSSAELSFVPDYAEDEATVLRRKRLHDAIAALPPGQRQCIQLWLDGFTHGEIARAVRIDENAVKSALRDAKKQLREQLEDGNESATRPTGS